MKLRFFDKMVVMFCAGSIFNRVMHVLLNMVRVFAFSLVALSHMMFAAEAMLERSEVDVSGLHPCFTYDMSLDLCAIEGLTDEDFSEVCCGFSDTLLYVGNDEEWNLDFTLHQSNRPLGRIDKSASAGEALSKKLCLNSNKGSFPSENAGGPSDDRGAFNTAPINLTVPKNLVHTSHGNLDDDSELNEDSVEFLSAGHDPFSFSNEKPLSLVVRQRFKNFWPDYSEIASTPATYSVAYIDPRNCPTRIRILSDRGGKIRVAVKEQCYPASHDSQDFLEVGYSTDTCDTHTVRFFQCLGGIFALQYRSDAGEHIHTLMIEGGHLIYKAPCCQKETPLLSNAEFMYCTGHAFIFRASESDFAIKPIVDLKYLAVVMDSVQARTRLCFDLIPVQESREPVYAVEKFLVQSLPKLQGFLWPTVTITHTSSILTVQYTEVFGRAYNLNFWAQNERLGISVTQCPALPVSVCIRMPQKSIDVSTHLVEVMCASGIYNVDILNEELLVFCRQKCITRNYIKGIEVERMGTTRQIYPILHDLGGVKLGFFGFWKLPMVFTLEVLQQGTVAHLYSQDLQSGVPILSVPDKWSDAEHSYEIGLTPCRAPRLDAIIVPNRLSAHLRANTLYQKYNKSIVLALCSPCNMIDGRWDFVHSTLPFRIAALKNKSSGQAYFLKFIYYKKGVHVQCPLINNGGDVRLPDKAITLYNPRVYTEYAYQEGKSLLVLQLNNTSRITLNFAAELLGWSCDYLEWRNGAYQMIERRTAALPNDVFG